MTSPTYAGDALKQPSGLWHGSKCKLNDLPCTEDCRRCSVALVWAAERVTDAINMTALIKGGQ